MQRWKKAYLQQIKRQQQEKQFYKREALEYALKAYKQQAAALTELYSAEARKLLERYAAMRREVLRQDKALRSIGQFSVYQERLITDVRQFTTLNLMPVLSVLQKLNIEAEEHAKLEHKRIKNMLTGINDFACQFDGNVEETVSNEEEEEES